MTKKLVIFGTGQIAELAAYYFEHDSEYDVEAFTVDSQYIEDSTFMGKPLAAFDNIESVYPPEENSMFVALSYTDMNKIREAKYLESKKKGYEMASYISSKASIFSNEFGDNCFVLEDNTIQPYVKIGNNVTLWSGNHIGHHSVIGDHTFISSHVVVSGNVVIGKNCFFGVNSTLHNNLTIADFALIGAGACISKSIEEPESVYTIKPAALYHKKSIGLL